MYPRDTGIIFLRLADFTDVPNSFQDVALLVSPILSLSHEPRFSTKDVQNTISIEIYSACETLLSKQVTDLYCGLRLTRVNWSHAE